MLTPPAENDTTEKQTASEVRIENTKSCSFTDNFVLFPKIILMSELTSQLAISKLKAILATFSSPDKLVIQYVSLRVMNFSGFRMNPTVYYTCHNNPTLSRS